MIHLSTGRAKIKSLAVRELKIAYGDLICVAYVGLSGEGSLSGEEERRLGSIMQEPGYELVALTQVPWKQRPLYHMRATGPSGEEVTKSFELLYRGVEITTGAIREHRHEVLMQQLAEKGLTGKGDGVLLGKLQTWGSSNRWIRTRFVALGDVVSGIARHQRSDLHPPRTWKVDTMSRNFSSI